jgi:hypothetical protein
MKSKLYKWIKVSVISSFFIVSFLFASQAQASVSENVFGSAWSENTGWVSFNSCPNPFVSTGCTYDYGVNVDKTTLAVKGVAWSDNLGWISFNPSEWGACPPGVSKPCTSFTNKWGSGGWARVVSVATEEALALSQSRSPNTGGFDGWISLGGSNFSAPFDTTKNVASSMPSAYQGKYVYTINSSSSNYGYFWGSEIMGWIDLKPKSSYDPNDGGVFLADISNETLTLTPTPSNGKVLAGDTVDIHWEVKGFTPTTCSGTMYDVSNNPITGRTDWIKTFNTGTNTSGDISGIEVPYDSSNGNSVVTKFTLTCSDTVKTVDNTVTITTELLTVFMKNASGGSCVSGNTSSLDWSTNDITPDCEIEATPAPGGSSVYYIPVSGISPTDDTNFGKNAGNGSTKYSFSCQNGSGAFSQTPVKAVTSGTVSIKQCVPDYSMTYNPSCQPFVLAPLPGTYEATVELSVASLFGFMNDVNLSDGGGIGSWIFSPGDTFSAPYNSKINATLSMSKVEYDSIDWSKPFTRDLLIGSIGFPLRTETIKLCEAGSIGGVKPKYKPF